MKNGRPHITFIIQPVIDTFFVFVFNFNYLKLMKVSMDNYNENVYKCVQCCKRNGFEGRSWFSMQIDRFKQTKKLSQFNV